LFTICLQISAKIRKTQSRERKYTDKSQFTVGARISNFDLSRSCNFLFAIVSSTFSKVALAAQAKRPFLLELFFGPLVAKKSGYRLLIAKALLAFSFEEVAPKEKA
jgi:hypothetical protein